MKQHHVIIEEGSRYQIEALAVSCGPDVSVTICGGTGYHVGAVALGCARPLKDGKNQSATVSVICAYDHRDDEVARWAARHLASAMNCRVSVSAGIHIDNATAEELRLLVKNCEEVCRKLLELYKEM